MGPQNRKTKIFLDSGDPRETAEALSELKFLDGQTTNPSLIAKNPDAANKKFSLQEIYDFYKIIVEKISAVIPQGSVSIEVAADVRTPANDMVEQARQFNSWIPNARIKLPTTKEGLKAAEILTKEGVRLNMTLVFSQEQAAAVYAATKGAKRGSVFLSPFVGRLDDIGINGMDLIKNILRMYKTGDSHVEILTASVRSLDHFLDAIYLGSDIVTAPLNILKKWSSAGKNMPGRDFNYTRPDLAPVKYQVIDLTKPWYKYNIKHELTDKGLKKFAADWSSLMH